MDVGSWMARAAALAIACGLLVSRSTALAGISDSADLVVERTFSAGDALVEMHFFPEVLTKLGVSLTGAGAGLNGEVDLEFQPTGTMFDVLSAGGDAQVNPGSEMLLHGGSFTLAVGGGSWTPNSVGLRYDPNAEDGYAFSLFDVADWNRPIFDLSGANADFQPDDGVFVMDADLRLSASLATALNIKGSAGAVVGWILVNVRTTLTEEIVIGPSGRVDSAVMYASDAGPGPAGIGPDVIVGDVINAEQFGRVGPIGAGTVGLAVGTRSCNKGTVELNWFAFPRTDHPMIPQNMYRLRTVDGTARMEQIGQGWLKHAFVALQHNFCSPPLGCLPAATGANLGVGCSDPYSSSINANPCSLGPRSEVNPYTGILSTGAAVEPPLGLGGGCGSNYPSRNHLGHVDENGDSGHDGIAHRVQVLDVDLMPTMNPGARYFAEGQYITRHEFEGGNGNQFNNVSHREVRVEGPDVLGKFTFFNIGQTIQEVPSISSWPGASFTTIEPDPGNDGQAVLGYQATNRGGGTWHYEYAVYNMNLDRSVGSFSVPIPPGVAVSNVEFYAPLNHAPVVHGDNYSNTLWTSAVGGGAITWSTDPIGVDPLANAVRFGTMYNFRFDANAPPRDVDASLGMFKTGEVVLAATVGPLELEPPAIVHGSPGVSFAAHAFSGYVDPRRESTNGLDVTEGMSVFTIEFSQEVENIGGGGLTTDAFVVRETGGLVPPTVTFVASADNQTVRLVLSRKITIREWTTIEARVQNMAGIAIDNLGDLGPGVFESDRIDIGFLPADTNQNGGVFPEDLIRFRQLRRGTRVPVLGTVTDYVDINRDGGVTPQDLVNFRQLRSGTGMATQVWAGVKMNNDQP